MPPGTQTAATASPVPRRDTSHPFLRLAATLSRACGVASALMIVASILVTCQMIAVRFLLNGSTTWQTEFVIYMMIAATLIGLPYVQLLRGHVNVDLLPIALPRRLRLGLAFVTLGTAFAVIGLLMVYGVELWHVAWARNWTSDTVWRVPLSIPYLAMPVGFGLYLVQIAADLFAVASGRETPFGLSEDR
ncbi:TRAP transporter small permease [Paroceanicella profunda]|uniref:TRAP transporter small permease protein n=1 Tax=Paroceanicella profunda TaxID=2579971 RepID=A0A5B8FRS3_9RHOB|nr:TRAP transporter small permease [Paroceanicella profunda]QDL91436.1 TRAP transporter small permease [Paroceanicella profunda]